MTIFEERYSLVYSVYENNKISDLYLIDKKLKRIYCGEILGNYSIDISSKNERPWEVKLPIIRNKFYLLRKEKKKELIGMDYLDFLKKYSLEQWAI